MREQKPVQGYEAEIKKLKETFDPSKYERVEDMPEEVRGNYAELPGGGFVRKTAKDLYDQKEEELKEHGSVSESELSSSEKLSHKLNPGLVTTDVYSLKKRILNMFDRFPGRTSRQEKRHEAEVASKVRQDSAQTWQKQAISKSEFDSLKEQIEDAEWRIDEHVALGDEETKAKAADLKKEIIGKLKGRETFKKEQAEAKERWNSDEIEKRKIAEQVRLAEVEKDFGSSGK